MVWLQVFKILLTLALSISKIVQENRLLEAGEAKATAKSLAIIAKNLQIGQDIVTEIEKMSDAELDEELQKDDNLKVETPKTVTKTTANVKTVSTNTVKKKVE